MNREKTRGSNGREQHKTLFMNMPGTDSKQQPPENVDGVANRALERRETERAQCQYVTR